MYYGEGAGTRRKQIKAVVDQRSKDPYYKQQFSSYLERQNMSEHATKARAERRAKDAASWTKKTGKGIANLVLGNAVPVATSAMAIYSLARMTGLDEIAIKKEKRSTISSRATSFEKMYIHVAVNVYRGKKHTVFCFCKKI